MNILSMSISFLPLLRSAVTCCAGHRTLEPGDKAPDFSLPGLSGEVFSLSSLRSRVVVLNFWRLDCDYCRQEMPYLEQSYQALGRLGLAEVVAIDLYDSVDKVRRYLEDSGLSVPVALDSAGEVALSYEIYDLPATFFIDRDGVIKEVRTAPFTSASQIIEVVDRLVKIS